MKQETIPYTYLLKNKTTGLFYYGVKCAKGCHPNTFWINYFTSSKLVKDLIKTYGKNDFEFEIRKTFKSKEAARNHEHVVLRRMKADKRADFLNRIVYPFLDNKNYIIVHNITTNKINHWPKDKEVPTTHKRGFPPTYKQNTPKGLIWINNGIVELRIPKESVMIEGFVKGKISGKGSKWFTNGSEDKKIYKGESIPDGFYEGRSNTKHLQQYLFEKDMIWINNGTEEKKINKNEIIKDGWIKGYLSNKRNKNTKWYNNGKEQKQYREDNVPDGWIKGKLKSSFQKERFTGVTAYNNGMVEIKLRPNEPIPEGFVKGGKKRNKYISNYNPVAHEKRKQRMIDDPEFDKYIRECCSKGGKKNVESGHLKNVCNLGSPKLIGRKRIINKNGNSKLPPLEEAIILVETGEWQFMSKDRKRQKRKYIENIISGEIKHICIRNADKLIKTGEWQQIGSDYKKKEPVILTGSFFL